MLRGGLTVVCGNMILLFLNLMLPGIKMGKERAMLPCYSLVVELLHSELFRGIYFLFSLFLNTE